MNVADAAKLQVWLDTCLKPVPKYMSSPQGILHGNLKPSNITTSETTKDKLLMSCPATEQLDGQSAETLTRHPRVSMNRFLSRIIKELPPYIAKKDMEKNTKWPFFKRRDGSKKLFTYFEATHCIADSIVEHLFGLNMDRQRNDQMAVSSFSLRDSAGHVLKEISLPKKKGKAINCVPLHHLIPDRIYI